MLSQFESDGELSPTKTLAQVRPLFILLGFTGCFPTVEKKDRQAPVVV
jgi:hypothetical protein